MPFVERISVRRLALPVAVLALALGACSMDRVSEMVPKASDLNLLNFEWNPYSAASSSVPSTFQRRALTPADFVNADGSCAEAAGAQAAADSAAAPAVALQMSECAIVSALGAPERVEIGSNERGERLAKLLYSRGERPGLYYFTAGHLTQVERVAEPEPPPRPQRQQRQPSQPRRSVS